MGAYASAVYIQWLWLHCMTHQVVAVDLPLFWTHLLRIAPRKQQAVDWCIGRGLMIFEESADVCSRAGCLCDGLIDGVWFLPQQPEDKCSRPDPSSLAKVDT